MDKQSETKRLMAEMFIIDMKINDAQFEIDQLSASRRELKKALESLEDDPTPDDDETEAIVPRWMKIGVDAKNALVQWNAGIPLTA